MPPEAKLLEQGARWAGQHALPLFAATLAVTRGQRWRMLGWVAAVACNGVVNTALKQMFARVRPLGLDGFAGITADGMGEAITT